MYRMGFRNCVEMFVRSKTFIVASRESPKFNLLAPKIKVKLTIVLNLPF